MVYSLEGDEGKYKIFKSEKDIQMITLVGNEIEILDLIKISFDYEMYLTGSNSNKRQIDAKELVNFCGENLSKNKIKTLECCNLGMSK